MWKKISRTYDLLSRTYDLLSRTYDLLCHTYDLLSRTYNLLSRMYEIISRTYEIIFFHTHPHMVPRTVLWYQIHIRPGGEFILEFELNWNGTIMDRIRIDTCIFKRLQVEINISVEQNWSIFNSTNSYFLSRPITFTYICWNIHLAIYQTLWLCVNATL